MKTKRILAAAALLMIATPALGDIAQPKPSPARSTSPKFVMNSSLEIVPDTKTYRGARLELPESTVKELRELMNTGASSQSLPQRTIGSSTNTIIAGLLLFASISLGGIWLVRSTGTRGQKTVACFLVGVATIGAAAIITQANAGPPPSYFWRSLQKNLSTGKATSGSLDIEIVPDGQRVRLIVPVRDSANGDD